LFIIIGLLDRPIDKKSDGQILKVVYR